MYNCINTTKLQKMHEELQLEYAGELGNNQRICNREFQHPNISLICWDAVLLRESLRERGYGNPPSPSLPNTEFGERARARARGRGRAHPRGKYTFLSSGRGRPGTSSGPEMELAGGRKERT